MGETDKTVRNSRMNEILDEANIIGFNERGELCAWFGGYTFNVYETKDWTEVRAFTSGRMVNYQNIDRAKNRMRSEGFTIFESA